MNVKFSYIIKHKAPDDLRDVKLTHRLGGCHHISAWGVKFFSEDLKKNDDPPIE